MCGCKMPWRIVCALMEALEQKNICVNYVNGQRFVHIIKLIKSDNEFEGQIR